MVDKSVKYYEGSLNPLPEWTKNDGTKTVFKSIRITEEENQNWKPETIHEFLSGENKSNDSIKISTLKHYLKGLYEIMNNNMNPNKQLEPSEMELLLNIEEVIDYE